MRRKTRHQKKHRRRTRRGGVLPDELLGKIAKYTPDLETRIALNRAMQQKAYTTARRMTPEEIANFDKDVVFNDLKYLDQKLKETLSSDEKTKTIIQTFKRLLTPSGIEFMKNSKSMARMMNRRGNSIPNEKPAEWFEDPAHPERMVLKGLARKAVVTTNEILGL